MHYSHHIVIDVIKAGELLCDAVYLNPFANHRQWYTTYEKNEGKTIVWLNTVILTKVEVKPINDCVLPDGAINKLRGDAIKSGAVYICDDTHDEILETVFSR